ncbi:MAG: hypothetical protein R2911_11020 [Caldilineaceae bacterium]
MTRFDHLKGCFGLPSRPIPKTTKIHIPDLKSRRQLLPHQRARHCVAGDGGVNLYFWRRSGIRGLDAVLEEMNGGCR